MRIMSATPSPKTVASARAMAGTIGLAAAIMIAPRPLDAAGAAGPGSETGRNAAALVQAAGCRECHSSEGVASDTRLVFPEPGSPDEAVREFVDNLLDLVNNEKPDESRLFRKPTMRMKHAGGRKVVPGTPEEATLRNWVMQLARFPQPAIAAQVLSHGGNQAVGEGMPRLRRLTANQYSNTLRDLTGDLTRPGQEFPSEDFVDGFKNQSPGQSASPVLIEAYANAARQAADRAVYAIRRGDRHHILPCPVRPAGAIREDGCKDRFVQTFGRRAFRRPLTEKESARYAGLMGREDDFLDGVRLVIEAMLQSPSFLYLTQAKDPGLAGYARASRLAYFLWDTMPDDALLDRAASGDMNTAEGTERVVREMLEGPRATQGLDEFTSQWLRFDQVLEAYKDKRLYPEFTRDLALAMTEETRRFIGDLMWNNRSFLHLFTANWTFVNADLASLYGLPASSATFSRVKYADTSERSGVFGHAMFLAGTSKPAETSPTARGLYIREHFLCQKVPPPPPNVDVTLAPLSEGKPMTKRDRLVRHLTDESCASCHRLIDGIGFGFEKFDTLGRWQEKLRVIEVQPKRPLAKGDPSQASAPESVVELPLDTTGTIVGLADSEIRGPRDVGRILAGSPAAQECVARQVFRYATGHAEGAQDHAVLAQVFADARRTGFRFKDLLVSVAKWSEFTPPEGIARAPGS